MDASKQRGSIVLTKQNIDGQDYIRIEVTVPRQSRLTGFISVISWSITKGVTSTT